MKEPTHTLTFIFSQGFLAGSSAAMGSKHWEFAIPLTIFALLSAILYCTKDWKEVRDVL